MTCSSEVRVFADRSALEETLIRFHEDAAREAVSERGRFTMALTGGSAASFYGALALASLPWDKVHVFFGDERAVPPTHADSNYRVANDWFLSKVPIPADQVHRIRGEIAPEQAAAEYEAKLLEITGTGALDVVHLGVGPDGHVCSLFPDHPLLGEWKSLVKSLDDSPKPPKARVTLTLRAIELASCALFIVSGAAKAAAMREATNDVTSSLPAAIVHRIGKAIWFADEAAAGEEP